MSSESPLFFNDDDDDDDNHWTKKVVPLGHNEVVCASEIQGLRKEIKVLRKEIKVLRADLIRVASRLTKVEQTIHAQPIATQEAQKNCKHRSNLTNLLKELEPILGENPIPITTRRRAVSPRRTQSLPWTPRAYATCQMTDTIGTLLPLRWHDASLARYMHLPPRMQAAGIGTPQRPTGPP